MEDIIVFNKANRDANVVYNSGSYLVPDGYDAVEFEIKDIDLVNEPSSTIIYWTIEKSEDGGQTWDLVMSGGVKGQDGNTPPFPIGRRKIDASPYVGMLVRSSLYFVSENSNKKQFSVVLRTL